MKPVPIGCQSSNKTTPKLYMSDFKPTLSNFDSISGPGCLTCDGGLATNWHLQYVSQVFPGSSPISTRETGEILWQKLNCILRGSYAHRKRKSIPNTRRRRRRGNGEETLKEEILEKIEETAREIRSSRRSLEEGLEKVKMEAEEGQWWLTEERRRSSSSSGNKYKNSFLMDVNGLKMMMNGDGTSSSVAVLKPTMSIGQILSRKLLLADESSMMMNGRVSLGED
ncbi:WEB family protein [Cardamine amara subsp. amara]|uniref:WEB family protein n=1 Tax=Cardamine amara subsp. amara TaxID=228776 RepID=A0ABD0ZYU8_CARAN